ncbi:MAG: 4Fe-4S dicluster domain-containing protein [Candidatus Helarchaeales archaeon]
MTTSKEIIDYDELDHEFLNELNEVSAANILACFQCGTCTASCPSAPFGYNIRQILKLIVLGFKHEILDSKLAWFCTECGKCAERCTQLVVPYRIVLELQKLAAQDGNIPDVTWHRIVSFTEKGRVVEIDELTDMKRERNQLPECKNKLPPSIEREFKTILKESMFDDMLSKIRKKRRIKSE